MIEIRFITADAECVLERHPRMACQKLDHVRFQFAHDALGFRVGWRRRPLWGETRKLTEIHFSECNWVGSKLCGTEVDDILSVPKVKTNRKDEKRLPDREHRTRRTQIHGLPSRQMTCEPTW